MSTLIYSSRWEIKRLALIYSENKQKNGDFSEQTALQFRFGEIVPKRQLALDLDLIETYRKYTIVQPGDLMLNGLNLNYDFVTQRVALVRKNGIITSAYISLRPRDGINTGYYCYLLKTLDSKKMFNGMGTGIRLTLSYNELRNMMLPFPPREEQDQIVRYLDWQVSKTNKLISVLKKQSALLKEQKQAVINEAVTKGLDPNVPMKDSGIEWCGEIPAEWRIDKIPRLFSSIGSGTTPASGNAKYYKDGTIPWINSGDLYTDKKRVESAGKSVNELALTDYSVLKLYQEAACVIAMYGASIGNAAIVDFPFCCNQACCVLSNPREDLLLDYIYYCTSAFKRHLIEKSRGGGQPNISQDMIRKVWIPLPDLEVQKKIVEYLSAHCERIDDLIENINNKIALLGEYRRRLVSDVVTGQIDVRNIEVPEFEYITDEADDESDDENIDTEETVDEEA